MPRVEPPRSRAPEPERARAAWWVGGHGLIDLGTIAPGTTFSPSVSLELAWRGGAASWGPAIRLSGYYASREYSGDVGGADLRWYGARLDACAFFLQFGNRLEAAPCAQLGVGALHAEGIAYRSNQSTEAWIDLGVSGRGRLLLTSWLAVEAQAGLVSPLTRHTLEFRDSDVLLYQVPAVGGRFSLGVSGKIP